MVVGWGRHEALREVSEWQIFRVILELDTVSYGACFKAFNYDLLLSGPRLLYSYEYIDSSVDNHPNHPQEMPKRF